MNYYTFLLFVGFTCFLSCNNKGKDSIEKADSANAANLDTGLNHHDIVIDENSSAFLVRVANSGMAETQVTVWAEQNAVYQPVREFAGMLYHDHSGLNDSVKLLAAQNNIVLPVTLSDDKQQEIDKLRKATGKDIDREFIKTMIRNHEASIEQFEKAILDTKDPGIRSFADKSLPVLRVHLDSARSLQKRFW